MDGMFSHPGIFFMAEEQRLVAVFPHGAALPLKVEPRAWRDTSPVARRASGAKWTFRKGPFFSREQRR